MCLLGCIYLFRDWILLDFYLSTTFAMITVFCFLLFENIILFQFLCQVSIVKTCLLYYCVCQLFVILTLFAIVLLLVLKSCVICFIYFFVMCGVVIYHSFVPYFSFLFCSLLPFVLVFSYSLEFIM